MRKFYLLSTLVLALLFVSTSNAQDFSNKGKEFWLCFPNHVPSSNLATLSIWITSDRASSGLVTITNGAFAPKPFNIAANGLQRIDITHAEAHIFNAESGIVIQKSIKIKTNPGMPAVVAYAQQWGTARTAATLLLPTNVLGKKYYATSFTQLGADNGQLARSQFQIIATKDNTVVKITPRTNGVTGATFIVPLPLAGDMYQYQATEDITGTLIESTGGAGGPGCLPIAVFSGSSNIQFGTNSCTGGSSYDPLFQQQYPISTWGKNFGFIPFGDYPNGNPYRVLASEDNTNVFFDGFLVATLNEGQIYPAAFTSSPNVLTSPTSITADKPIAVMQYAQKRDCSGSNNGDPDMVILNPIEQNIDRITVFTSTQQNINRQWLNVLIKTIAAPTFTIDGVVPSTPFLPAINIPGYSYLTHLFSPAVSGSKLLRADSGFNAICYGFQQGNYESYAYSAGTNVKDPFRQIGVVSQYGIEATPSACIGSSFKFKMSLPYCADSIQWDLSNLPGPPPQPPISLYSTCVPGPGGPDSTTVVNGKTLYWYSLPLGYIINTAGVYTVTITTYSPNLDGCGTEQEFDFDLTVYDPPTGSFTWTTSSGCSTQPVQFNETTPQLPKTTYQFWWDFGDPASGPANNSTLRNPTHIFSGGGTFTVSYVGITTPGCLLDTIRHQVTVNEPPVANFTVTGPFCINDPIIFTDNSLPGPSATINKWTWDFGDGSPQVIVFAPNPPNQVHPYAASGTYNATLLVETTTGCPSIVFTRQVIIGPNGTITLTSAPGTDNQTVCINTPITNITYLVAGGGTGGSVSGLPAGVTGTFAAGIITITGTPTVSGTFNYSVTSTGACVNPIIAGTITVDNDGTLALTSSPGTDNQTVCINTPITNITYLVGGGGTGGSVSGLPAGITGTFAGGVISITGTPTVAGIFNYTVTTTGPCIIPTSNGRITVTDDGTLTLTSAPGTNNQTVCINIPIVNITYAVGGTGTGGSVSGLPAGVTGTFAGGVITITGTPTVAGTFNYIVTTTGPCAAPTANGTIIVTDDGTLTLTSGAGTDNQTICINTPVATITYTVGGSGTGGTVSGLPAGVTGTFAGGVISITGTPTVAGIFNYTVTTTGPCIIPTANGRITVTDDGTLTLTSAPGTNNQTVCINVPIVNITYAVGGTGTGGSVSGLPAGVTGTFAGGVITITGTPTVAGTFNYIVTTTGPCAAPTANGTIIVTDDGTLTLTSGAGTDNQTICINTPVATITYTVGGSGSGGTVSGLPAGVTGTFAGGVISITGTPTVAGIFNYTVTTTGPCIIPTANGRITVTDDGTLTLTSAPGTNNQTICINSPITTITYAVGGTATSGSVSGLPAGVTGIFAGGVITITGTPTASGTFIYTVTTIGPCVAPTATGTITVTSDGTITLTSGAGTDNQNACINNPIITITYAVGGSGTGGSVSGLPAGVTATFAGGIITISGSPTVNGIFNYTVTTTGPCVTPGATGTINVTNAAIITLSSAPGTDNQIVCINTPIINITYLVGGSGTGGSVSGLPAGVTGSFAGGIITITGSPTVVGTFNYTVNTTGPCGTPTATGTITVNDNSTLNLSSGPGSNVQTVCINTPITNITYLIAGGGTGASITAGSLPAGVSGSFSGGVFTISGTPTVSGIFNFTISSAGPCINPTAIGTITVTSDGTLTLTSAPATTNQTVCINTAIIDITYSVGGSGTGGSVSGLPGGVTGTFAGGVITITGTPSGAGTFNYTVNTTGPCVKPTANGTIIVNDNSTLTLSSGPGSNIQTVCINTPITNITYSIAGGGTGASITAGALPAGVSGSFGGGVFTISGTPTVSGIFNFTVGTTGPCLNTLQSGTITVTADGTLTLTSAPATTNQTVCVNTPITNITYAVGGTGTSGSVSGLPTGVTGTFAGGVITITGTPTVAGTFNYSVTTTGPCVKPTATGTITVNDNSTLSLSSAPGSNVQTVCINTAIANITYAVGGGGTSASITVGSLPAGVNGTYSGGIFTISGIPTASGTFNFTVGTTGPCINTSQAGTITVTADGSLALNSAPGTDVQTVCINTAINNIRYTIGGSGTGASISAGSLPAGVNGVYSGGVFTISGTPTVSGVFNFTIGSAGPCLTPALTGTITINPDHTITRSSAASTTNQTVCSDKQIAPIAYTLSGGATGALVTGLPAGVTSSISGSTLTINGFPSIAGVFNYSVITTGNSCITASANGTISVLQTPAITFNSVPGVCADVPSFLVTASPALGIFSGPGINAAGLFNPAAAGAGNHIIRYTFTALNGCPNFKEQTISVFPMPIANAGPDRVVLEGGQVTLTPSQSASLPVTYLWTPATYLNNPVLSNPVVNSPLSDMTYTLRVTTANGCSTTDQVFVKLLKKVEIPNIFSPNGDGIHDTWVILYLESYPGCTVDIFNRYGQKIYHSDGYSKAWDGTIKGNPVPIGTYYYIVNPKNGRTILSGYVDVIR